MGSANVWIPDEPPKRPPWYGTLSLGWEIGKEEKTTEQRKRKMHGREHNCRMEKEKWSPEKKNYSPEKKSAQQRRKTAWQRRKMLIREEQLLGTAAVCISEGHCTCELNNTKIAINATRSKEPNFCFTNVPGSQIYITFEPSSDVFELTASLGQVHQMTPNTHMTLKSTKSNIAHICFTSVPEFHISLHFTLQPAVVKLTAGLRNMC